MDKDPYILQGKWLTQALEAIAEGASDAFVLFWRLISSPFVVIHNFITRTGQFADRDDET